MFHSLTTGGKVKIIIEAATNQVDGAPGRQWWYIVAGVYCDFYGLIRSWREK